MGAGQGQPRLLSSTSTNSAPGDFPGALSSCQKLGSTQPVHTSRARRLQLQASILTTY
nr:MAG TPA: hypothetical protein [Caudoviricetes sp.]